MAVERLTDKQQAFVLCYLESLNATDAAQRAGYKGKRSTLAVVGHENLRKPAIVRELERRSEEGQLLRNAKGEESRRVKVYLIRAENGLIKIGKTIDVEQRFRSLNMSSPVDLELVHVFDTLFGDELEESLHAAYDDKRVKGEWFNLTDSDIAKIVKLYGQPDR